jgi:flagellar basal-body rod protein FlgG
MLRTMITATNSLSQVQKKLDTVSNNIANSNTTGYKAQQASFSELMYQQFNNDKLDRTVRQSPVGIRYGVGAQIAQIQTNQTQGGIQATGRDLDVAFTKANQYLNILQQNGDTEEIVYSRQGNLYVSPTGNGAVSLVDASGNFVADANGNRITFADDAESFTISENGTLNITFSTGAPIAIDLGITQLNKPQVLESKGGSYIGLPDNFNELGYNQNEVLVNLQGGARQNVSMMAGALEESNVDLSQEMTDLIAAQRQYQFNSRAITIADQMLGLINGIR